MTKKIFFRQNGGILPTSEALGGFRGSSEINCQLQRLFKLIEGMLKSPIKITSLSTHCRVDVTFLMNKLQKNCLASLVERKRKIDRALEAVD